MFNIQIKSSKNGYNYDNIARLVPVPKQRYERYQRGDIFNNYIIVYLMPENMSTFATYLYLLKMSRLNDLYKAMETLRKEGLPVNEDLERKANEIEEEIIKKEILPILTKSIEPALQPVQRELVLVVDYIPGQPISVHLSRKRNFTADMPDAKEIVVDPEVAHDQRDSKSTDDKDKIQRGSARDMAVFFPDGTIIAEKTAVDTLMATVKKIGVARVRQVVEEYNLKFCKVPVISNRRDAKYGKSQKDLGNGWLLITHSNNPMKKKFIEKVSQVLNLGIKVTLNE